MEKDVIVSENEFPKLLKHVMKIATERKVNYVEDVTVGELILCFENACIIDNNIFFSAMDFNGLFRGDLKSGEVTFLEFFSSDYIRNVYNHFCVEKVGDYIYFIPDGKDGISVLDLSNNHICNTVIIPFESSEYRINYSCAIQNEIYLFGMDLRIYKLNTETNQVCVCEALCPEMSIGRGKWYNNQVARIDNFLFVPVYKENLILVIDWRGYFSKIIELEEGLEIYGCCYIDGYIWITAMNVILKCDIGLNIIKKFEYENDSVSFDFQNIRNCEDEIFFVDNTNKGFLKYRKKNHTWSYSLIEQDKGKSFGRWMGQIYFLPDSNYYFDMDSGKLKELCGSREVCFHIEKRIILNEAKKKNMGLLDMNSTTTEDGNLFSLENLIYFLKE